MDNHESHISVAIIDFCKDNGITLLTFPPHCSHKLQPLDRSVYGPLKKYVNGACDGWMKNNPGKTMTIYDIPKIAKQPLERATSQTNILAGFRTTGISPFNRDIFKESDFQSAAVTDRDEVPNSSNAALSTPQNTQLQLEVMAPYPKAGPRKATRRGRKKGKTAILTDTPIRNQVAADEANKKTTVTKRAEKRKSRASSTHESTEVKTGEGPSSPKGRRVGPRSRRINIE
jgi:DDE superfamily endonuclease